MAEHSTAVLKVLSLNPTLSQALETNQKIMSVFQVMHRRMQKNLFMFESNIENILCIKRELQTVNYF